MGRMITLIRVNNLADFDHYREQISEVLEPYGGEIRFPVEQPMTLDEENGLGDFSQTPLFWFSNAEAKTEDWYELDAHQGLLEPRFSAGKLIIIGIGLELDCV